MGSVAETSLPQDCLHSRHMVCPTYCFNVAAVLCICLSQCSHKKYQIATKKVKFLEGFWQITYHLIIAQIVEMCVGERERQEHK